MKFLVTILLILTLFSCSSPNEIKNSLEPLRFDYIDDIPYLMHQNQIDSVFEVVTYGKVSYLDKSDTLNFYYLDSINKVSQRLRSFMCCSYVYEYDTIGFLKEMRKSTDYFEYFSYDRKRNNDTIYEIEESNLGSEINFKYFIKNKKLISKIGLKAEDTEFSDVTNYEYNKDEQLIKKTRTRLNHPSGDFNYIKNVTTYDWNKNVLSHKTIEQYSSETEKEPFYISKIKFDSIGFPKENILFNNQKVVFQTEIIRY